jgi:hypothetical protein
MTAAGSVVRGNLAHALNDRGARQVNLYRALQFPVSAYVMVPRVLSALGVAIESGEAS